MKPKVALVTGGGRGIGLGVSKALLAQGYDLAFCGRKKPEEVQSLEELRSTGKRVVYVQADVADPADRERLIATVREKLGGLQVLVNNAGVAPAERLDILDATPESYDRVMNINLKGPYFLTQLAARWMVEQSESEPDYWGCIVFVSSISATVPSVNRGEYCISKAGLGMACRLWSARLAEYGIPVYEVRPGITMTDMTAGVKEKYDQMIADGLLLQKRWGTPDDVGRAVGAIARGDLAYSTGQVITVDGSLTKTVL